MEMIILNSDNIADEHICCGISDKKCKEGYEMKKDWMRSQFGNGYVFRKYDVRHKVFIDYMPANKAWVPIEADGYMYVNCFWVAGKYKGKGHGIALLEACERDAKGMKGLVVVTGKKKKPFLSDPKYLKKHGFTVCDSALPDFQLMVKKFDDEAADPKFKESAKTGTCPNNEGLVVYYSNQCPFTEYYVNKELVEIASDKNIPITINKISTYEASQSMPCPFGIHSIYYNGIFLTNEILTKKSFEKKWTKLNPEV